QVQIKKWIECEFFEIDLSFKRVANEFNEFEINYYDQVYNTLLTFARIFTNQSTALAYQRMFEDLFNLIKQLTETSPSFKHIHGEGWGCIIGDLDIAQAIGLDDIRADMEALLTATPEKVDLIFNKLLTYDDNKLT
ncbi:11966_t:CDS:2, partial [Cetraspora pellucida]